MKKIIPSLILLISYCSLINAQSSGWFFINPLPTNMTLNSVKIFDQNNAIAIGYHGTVMRTTNGGLSWSNPLTTTSATGLDKLHYFVMNFFNANGLIIGDNAAGISKIFRTTNMGATWTFVSQLASTSRAMHFINMDTGWVSSSLKILKTTNGGSNWQISITTFPSDISSILFVNDLTGFATIFTRKIFKTSDGGMNWYLVDSSGVSNSNLFFINIQTGFVCGDGNGGSSLIRKTTDAGITWITKLSNSSTGLISSVNFINSATGFAVGGGYGNQPASAYRSIDAGETWNQISINTTYHLNSVGFSGNLGLAVGYGGRIARSTDQGLSWSVSPAFHQHGLSFYSASFIDANTGWTAIGGYTGYCPIYKSTNGGLNWEIIYMAQYGPDYIKFLNSSTGYYKSGNYLYKSTNSGYNWTQLPPHNINVTSVNIVDVSTVWACGYTPSPVKPRVIKTTNSGINWDTIPVPLDYSSVTAFDFINNNTGWISKLFPIYPMGSYCKIFRTTNGGLNWVDLRTDTGLGYSKINFINNLTGWASGSRFIKTTNGGENWITMQTNGAGSLFQFIDANTGWNTGNGPVYKTTNGGLNWYPQVDIGFAGAADIQLINSQTGWMVGSEGLIIKTTNSGELVGIHSISNENEISEYYLLFQNYPNPFNPVTKIKFDVPLDSRLRGNDNVTLKIYDVLGREIAILVNERLSPGTYEVEWDGTNHPSGVYFYKFTISDYTETRKMVLVK